MTTFLNDLREMLSQIENEDCDGIELTLDQAGQLLAHLSREEPPINSHVRDAIVHGRAFHASAPSADPHVELARRFARHGHTTTNDLATNLDPAAYRDALAFAALALSGAAHETENTKFRDGLALASNLVLGMAVHMANQAAAARGDQS